MLCPTCSKNVRDDADYCIYCGKPLPDRPQATPSAPSERQKGKNELARSMPSAGLLVVGGTIVWSLFGWDVLGLAFIAAAGARFLLGVLFWSRDAGKW